MIDQTAVDFSTLVGRGPLVVLNHEGTTNFDEVAYLTSLYGGRFRHVNLDGAYVYNPLGTASRYHRVQIVLNMRSYEPGAEMYRAEMQKCLDTLFTLIDAVAVTRATAFQEHRAQIAPGLVWDRGTMALLNSIVRAAPGDDGDSGIDDLYTACLGTSVESTALEFQNVVRGRTQCAHAFDELRGRFRTLSMSSYWRVLEDQGCPISFFRSPHSADVTVFDLRDDNSMTTEYMSALIRSNLDVAGTRVPFRTITV